MANVEGKSFAELLREQPSGEYVEFILVDGEEVAIPDIYVSNMDLLDTLRMGDTDEEMDVACRLYNVAIRQVNRYAPFAPSEVKGEALIRFAGYLYDQPTAGRGAAYSRAFTNSGASAILAPWRCHRGGKCE